VDFGQLLRDAWRMTWRARGLWLFGFFAGGASGTCSGSGGNYNARTPAARGAPDVSDLGPQVERALQQMREVLPTILPYLLVGATALLLILLALWLISVASRAAVIAGGSQLATGQTSSMSSAWDAGLQAFGRLLLLDALLLVAWLIVVGLIGLYVASAVLGAGPGGVDWLQVLLVGLGVLAILAIVGSLVGILVAFAQRAIVLDGAGPLQALRGGFVLFRQHLGTSLLVWLIGLAAGIGIAIGMVVVLLGVAIPAIIVALIGVGVGAVAGAAGSWPVFVLDAIAVLAVFFVYLAAANTFMWHYWTLAYVRLSQPALGL
jgi:hypothetical protein